MTTIYTTKDGDTVDAIAWRHYQVAGARPVQAILAANAGLADRGPVLPAGVDIELPDLVAPGVRQGVRLWD